MRLLLIVATILAVACGSAGAVVPVGFAWTEDFEGALAPEWSLESDCGGFVGVVEDPTEAGNHALRVDTLSGGYAFGWVSDSAFEYLSGDSVNIDFRFYLESDCSYGLFVLGSDVSGIVGGTDYLSDPGTIRFDVPTNVWLDFSISFSPDGSNVHDVWVNGDYKGQFTNWDALPDAEDDCVGFFVGDDDMDNPCTYCGAAMWDDICVSGPMVPEPGSLLALGLGLGVLVRRRKSS